MRRLGYYGANEAAERVALTASPLEPPPVDRVTGARAIAALLGLTDKQVYRLVVASAAAGDPMPVRTVPGLGLSGDRATILLWWARQHGVLPPAPRSL